MAAEEEALIEVEAAESVYGDDCVVITHYPPHLNLQIKPRTAEVSSQQFVEAIIGIRASYKYPDEPPEIVIIDSKGLDEQRQNQLITSINNKARELSSNSMLVALCEEAVEKLTTMNHPDGDCPLCLSPLVEDGASNDSLPFMKLMSCFHCFHCECIIRWWNWLQMQNEVDNATLSRLNNHKNTEDGVGNCPVCRKVFHAKDIEHVLDLVGAYSQLNLEETESTEHDMVLHSDSEKARRMKFETILNLQQENNGLIEPKKTEVLMPGMFIPRPATTTAAADTAATAVSSSDKEAATNSEHKTKSKRNKPSGNNRRRSGPGIFHPRPTTTTAASTAASTPAASSSSNTEGVANGEQETEYSMNKPSGNNRRRSGPGGIFRSRLTTTTAASTTTATASASSSSSNTEGVANGEQETEFAMNKPSGNNRRRSGPAIFRPHPTTTTAASTPTATVTASSSSTTEGIANGEQETESTLNKPSGSNHRSWGPRNRYGGKNSRTQVNRQWIIKDDGNAQ